MMVHAYSSKLTARCGATAITSAPYMLSVLTPVLGSTWFPTAAAAVTLATDFLGIGLALRSSSLVLMGGKL